VEKEAQKIHHREHGVHRDQKRAAKFPHFTSPQSVLCGLCDICGKMSWTPSMPVAHPAIASPGIWLPLRAGEGLGVRVFYVLDILAMGEI
jgi:hypothetical protein